MWIEDTVAKMFEKWSTLGQDMLEAWLCLLTTQTKIGQMWLQENPDLYEDPMASVDPESFGVHQRPDCNVMFHRRCVLNGRTIWVFEHHIEAFLRML